MELCIENYNEIEIKNKEEAFEYIRSNNILGSFIIYDTERYSDDDNPFDEIFEEYTYDGLVIKLEHRELHNNDHAIERLEKDYFNNEPNKFNIGDKVQLLKFKPEYDIIPEYFIVHALPDLDKSNYYWNRIYVLYYYKDKEQIFYCCHEDNMYKID